MRIKKIIKIIAFTLFFFVLLSCKNYSKIKFSAIVGDYYNADSINYTYLKLREDSTFILIQSPLYGDAMFYNYGYYNIENNNLSLYNGIDFSNNLIIDSKTDYHSDTLNVFFDENLFSRFPDLKATIENDTDLKIAQRNILILKSKYWDIKSHLCSDSYQYVPLSLTLRSDKFYATIEYIFQNKKLSISLNDTAISKTNKKLLTKYYLKDSILYSKNESYKVIKNRLIKTKR